MTEHTDPTLAAVTEYLRLRALTEVAIEDYRLAVEAGDFKEAEQRFSDSNGATFAGLVTAMKTRPTTTDGAVALMRLVADNIEDMAEDPAHHPKLISALRAAADAIQGTRS